jgi:hypothetical protein
MPAEGGQAAQEAPAQGGGQAAPEAPPAQGGAEGGAEFEF